MDPAEKREKFIDEWVTWFKKGTDFDLWGQPVEAIESYQRLSSKLRQYHSPKLDLFSDEQKKVIGKIIACLELRSKALQHPGRVEGITLDDLRRVEQSLKNLLDVKSKEFPLEVTGVLAPSTPRAEDPDSPIHGPPLALSRISDEEKEEDESLCQKSKGNLFPAPVPQPGQTSVAIHIEKIALKDASQYIDPYITMSVKDMNGANLMPTQDTPIATHKEDTSVYFDIDVYMQKPLEALPHGFAVFFEFKHYKPKKQSVSTKCWAFMERDELKEGTAAIELYKKPTDYRRKKIHLLTIKPLYLYLKLTLS